MVSQDRLLAMPLRLLTTSLLLTALLGACSIAMAQDETPPLLEIPTAETPPPSQIGRAHV